MIEVRHKTTGTVLWRSEDDSFNGKILADLALAEADLEGRSLAYACLRNADLKRANLSGAMLGNAVLDGANLERADLSGCDLTSASLLGAKLREAELLGATLRYAHFGGADLQGAQLARVDASMADLRANLRNANLVGADLRGANLAGANLQYADLSHADLTNANLAGANLAGANLRGARLDGAKIQRNVNELQQLAVATAQPVMSRRPISGRPASSSQVNFDSLSVRCPRCDFENRVPIDSHSRKVGCRLCKKAFYVDVNGQSTLVAPPAGQVAAQSRGNLLPALVGRLRAWHFLALFVLLGCAAGGIWGWQLENAAMPLLPDSLVERARWVADAYAHNDPGRIARLQATGTRGQLDDWLGKRQSTAAGPAVAGTAHPAAQVKVLFQDDKQGKAAVLAQWPAPASTAKDVDSAHSIALYWLRLGEDWRFDLEQTLQKPGR